MTWSGIWRMGTAVALGGVLMVLLGCGRADHGATAVPAGTPARSRVAVDSTSATGTATSAAPLPTDSGQAATDASTASTEQPRAARATVPAADSGPAGGPSLEHLADVPPGAAPAREQPPGMPAGAEADSTPSNSSAADSATQQAPAVVPAAAATPVAGAAPAATQGVSGHASAQEPQGGNVTAEEPVADTIDTEPLFTGWPTPKVALVITGRQHGYLEPCGCAGLDRQKGGLIRRYAMITQLRAKGWKVVPIDAGNQVRRFGRQPEIKYQITIEGLRMMGYQVITFGPDDLRLSAGSLFSILSSSPETFVSANVAVLDPSATSPYRVIAAGGKKIGVTAVLDARNQKRVNSEDVTMEDARQALRKVWPQLESKHCDLNVLICHGTIDESTALGKEFPGFQMVITTGGAGEPRREPQRIEGTKTLLIEVGTKGMFAGVVGLFDDAAAPLRYQRVPLDARFHDSPEMLELLAAYQDQLKAAGFAGLGIRPQPHPSGMKFVGSESCQDCHPKAYKVWEKGRPGFPPGHGKAYQTLLAPPKRAKVPRNYDPECISCHVVGWNPQQYYPYESGYLSLEKTPKLINVGCEDCHGPGAAHVAAENGDVDASDEQLERLRKAMKLPLQDAEQKCLECHDLDNSPDFQAKGAFEKYWEKIKH